jgi:D-alanyl-D-alanine carboxypeptidase
LSGFVTTVSSLFASWAAAAADGAPPAERARVHLRQLVASRELPGIQYRVIGPQGVVFALDAGLRDVGAGQPMLATTLQMAYSTTKVVTAIAVLQLVERGRLALDAPLTRYLADHPYGAEVTIRQLLAHTAGLPNPMPLDWFAVEGAPFDRDERLRQVLADNPRLRRRPGQAYGYTNVSYWLLEKAVEAVSGQDFAEYVADHLFAPLSIAPEAARFDLPAATVLAAGYSPRWRPLTLLLELMTPGAYWGSASQGWVACARVVPHGRAYGGLYASADSLAALLGDLLRPRSRLLSTASKEAMFTRQTTADGRVIPATLGWVTGELHGVPYVGKQGGGLGFHGNLRVYPDRGLATVMLANRTEISPGPIDARSDALDAIFLSPPRAGAGAILPVIQRREAGRR